MSQKANAVKKISPKVEKLAVPLNNTQFLISSLIVFLSSLVFTAFWKYRQLELVSKELVRIYPLTHWLHTFTVGTLLFLSAWLFYSAIVNQVGVIKDRNRLLLWDAFSFLAWTLPWLGISPKISFFIFVSLKILALVVLLKNQNPKWRKDTPIHLGVFFLILLTQTQFNGVFSPKNWDNPIATLNEGESLVNSVSSSLHHYFYVNAKLHDLSGFESSSFGSLPHSPTAASSPVFGSLAWLLDFPSADPECFYRLVMALFFFWFVLGSFGFYLFVFYGLKLSLPTAIIAGLLGTLGNHSLSLLSSHYVPFFTGVFLCLPYALLFIKIAFQKQSWQLAFLSGSALSLNFYLLQPHPDSLMHATVFWTSYVFFLGFVSHTELVLQTKIKIILSALVSFTLGSLFSLLPVFQSVLANELYVWGHLDGILVRFNFMQAWNGVLIPLLITFGFLVLAFGIGSKKLIEKLDKKSDFWFFLFWFVFLGVCFLPGSDSPFIKLLMQMQLQKINFLGADRTFLYFSLSAFVLLLYGVEFSLQEERISSDVFKGLCIVAALVIVFYPYADASYAQVLSTSGIAAALLLWFSFSKWQKSYNYTFLFLMLATVFALVHEGSAEWKGAKLDRNPTNCKFYLSLRGLWIKTRHLKEDTAANREMLRNRLVEFEENLASSPIAGETRSKYQNHLASFSATSALNVSEEKFANFAPLATSLADELYLKNPRCPYPRDFGGIYDPNSVVLFDKVQSRTLRISGFTGVTMNTGIGEGLFLNDATCGVDPRFMWGYAPVSTLYFFPGEYYQHVGNYEALMLGRLKTDVLSNEKSRKIFDIAGIDLINANREDFKALQPKEDFEVVEDDIAQVVVLKNKRSYGVAYLATKTFFKAPRDLSFASLHPPFDGKEDSRFNEYKNKVDALTAELAALPEKYSAIIETTSLPVTVAATSGAKEEKLIISNILGNKAAFKVSCQNQPCRLVFNQAATVGWEAYSDETPLKIERANYAFLSVLVSKGEHLVWFEHRPLGMIAGIILTLFSFLAASYFAFRQ